MAKRNKPQAQPQDKGLNDRQRAFCLHYVGCWCATEAAKLAGYSEKTAQEQGSRLLSNVMVKAEIDRLKLKVFKKYEITAERSVQELAAIAYSNLSDHASWDESQLSLKQSDRITEDGFLNDTRAVKGVKVKITSIEGEHGCKTIIEQKIELHDKNTGLANLMKHQGLFPAEKHEHTGKEGGPIQVSDGLDDGKRAAALAALLERARARVDGSPVAGDTSDMESTGGATA